MSLLDDAYRRHLVLKAITAEESSKAFTDPMASRHLEFGIVAIGDDYSIARLASPKTVTGILPFDVRRCLTILTYGRCVGSITGLED
jgi:hypothetical protein